MTAGRIAAASCLAALVAACSDLDEGKLEPRPITWNEELVVTVLRSGIPREPRYVNGDKSRPFALVVCVALGRDDPSPALLRKLGAGTIPVIGRSRCEEKRGDDRLFEASSGRPASLIRLDRIECIDDSRCMVWVDGRYGGVKSWWTRGAEGWREVSRTQQMTWIS